MNLKKLQIFIEFSYIRITNLNFFFQNIHFSTKFVATSTLLLGAAAPLSNLLPPCL
jgi:hypothetical protein